MSIENDSKNEHLLKLTDEDLIKAIETGGIILLIGQVVVAVVFVK